MPVKLTCPVCERSQIEENVCPNCETDLTTYRILAELPTQNPVVINEQKQTIPLWLPITIAVVLLLLGIGLGFAGNSLVSQQQPSITSNSSTASNSIPETKPDELVVPSNITETPKEVAISPEIKQPHSESCGGFNYVARKGDSLSLIASNFYGDGNSWSLISQSNSQIQGRESFIKIGEVIFVPNLRTNCLRS